MGVTTGAFRASGRGGSSSELDSLEEESLLDESEEAELEDFEPLLRKGDPFLSTSESSESSLDDDEPLLPDDDDELELDEDELDSLRGDGTKGKNERNDKLIHVKNTKKKKQANGKFHALS